MVEGKMKIIKYLMFIFNFVFWLSGLALIIIGAVTIDKYGGYFSYTENKFATAPIFIVVVGVIVFVIGFLGCCGAVKENWCMVATFAVLLGIIFILEIVAGILGFVYKKEVEGVATSALKEAVKDYGNDEQHHAKEFLDWAQQFFECCGSNGASDYSNSTGNNDTCSAGQGVKSCHKDSDCAKDLYGKGCKQSVIDFVESKLVLIGVVALCIAFIQLLGIIFAYCLMKAIKGEYEVV